MNQGDYFVYMAQFSHQAYLNYQASEQEAFQPSQQKVVKFEQLAKLKQANIQTTALNWKLKELDQEDGKKKENLRNRDRDRDIEKNKQGKLELKCSKCSKILKHASSLSRHEKKCKALTKSTSRILLLNTR